jgi:hypothetical protein
MPTNPPQHETGGYLKNRFLSVVIGNAGVSAGIRIIPTELPPPYAAYEDAVLWVGIPTEVSENSGIPGPPAGPGNPGLMAAPLTCDPELAFFRDWSTIPVLHLFHELIVPGGKYDVSVISSNCDRNESANFSAPLDMDTTKWGDAVGVFDQDTAEWTSPEGVITVADVVALLDKFKNLQSAPTKTRCDLEPAIPDFLINISDVTQCLGAFSGAAYPFLPPPSCP